MNGGVPQALLNLKGDRKASSVTDSLPKYEKLLYT